MRYLVASGLRSAELPPGCRAIADGETISFEQPWNFGAPLIAQVDDGADLTALTSKPAMTAFLVEGIEPPGAGQAFAIGAHRMRDADAFKPYAARVADVIKDLSLIHISITVTGPAITPDRSITTNRPATGAPGDSGMAGTGMCGACGSATRRLAKTAHK